jgi:protein tyrosine phosphatase (PTP) superfamily phosphohydrolase (DUF442 family)
MIAWIINIFGFVLNQFKRFFPAAFQSNDLTQVFNYHYVPGLFATSGQPNAYQLDLIANNGYQVVINLAPTSFFEGSIIDEEKILTSKKVTYLHIPVDFNNPLKTDFRAFADSVKQNKHKKIWVHCAANMRVSAFVYKYRRDELGLKEKDIYNDMKLIWKPNKTWLSFLNIK